MLKRPLDSYLNDFALKSANDTGGIVWKNDDGLQMGIIVGQDEQEEKYVVFNQPSLRYFRLQKLSEFKNGHYCYFDFNRKIYNRIKIATLSFELLHQFNEYNNQKYPTDFKLEIPQDESTEVPTKEFSKGVGSVVYRAAMLHVLEDKVKTGLVHSRSSFRKGLSDFARQFRESVSATFSGNAKTKPSS